MKKRMPDSTGKLASGKKEQKMSLTREQKKELNRLDSQYERINKISGSAGMNPDKFINEFSYKFMDVSELNRQQLAERNEGRHQAFRNEPGTKSRKRD